MQSLNPCLHVEQRERGVYGASQDGKQGGKERASEGERKGGREGGTQARERVSLVENVAGEEEGRNIIA